MTTSRDQYYTEMYKDIVDYNDRNDAPPSNEQIQEALQNWWWNII